MHESIIVIFIFTIIFTIALVGIYQYNISSINDIRDEIVEDTNLHLLSNLPLDPKLQYSELGDEKSSVDTLKLLNLELEDLGFRTIEIKQTYPEINNVECNNLNYPECGVYVLYNRERNFGNKEIVSIPVSLYFPLTKETRLGSLVVTTHG